MKSQTITVMLSILLLAVGIFALFRYTQQYAPTGAQSVTQTNLSVNTTCIININQTFLNFGNVNPNTTYTANNISVNFSNTGNYFMNVSVGANDWAVNESSVVNRSLFGCNNTTRFANWSASIPTWENMQALLCGTNALGPLTAGGLVRITENQSYPLGKNTYAWAGEADNNSTFKITVRAGIRSGYYNHNVSYIGEC